MSPTPRPPQYGGARSSGRKPHTPRPLRVGCAPLAECAVRGLIVINLGEVCVRLSRSDGVAGRAARRSPSQQINHSSFARVCKFARVVQERESRWRVPRCAWPSSMCCCACRGRARRVRSRVQGRVAVLSQGVAAVQVCSDVCGAGHHCAAHDAFMGILGPKWLL